MRALRVGLLVVSQLALATKLFTFEASLRDDPTVSLVLRPTPSLENQKLLDDSSQLAGALVLSEDENAFWASGLYSWIVSAGWWLLPLLLVAAWVVPRMRRVASRSSQTL
ncbi:hypothetical protein ACN28I_07905 [Archangium gephyra]|uniref:hypothetical protein n=1 Tax=Archangium gephyra TaxID=48 RepID=UPI003B7627F0